ncbi:hypothetical protein [Paragemmobacter straminiformis]|uniref:Sulfatase n=1 Tax=Paragemmobacter straminiformis TaxID=2045119 RepID=A0A842IAZ4_9RHOB|nr:hypothetical protein [Gemmobacter straminiformis]MBC2836158.1 hypothetical protein [Gemmobacter straminiformis]
MVILLTLVLALLVSTALLSFAPRRIGWLLAAALAAGAQGYTACLLAPASGPSGLTLAAGGFALCLLGAWVGRGRADGSQSLIVPLATALAATALVGSVAYLTPEALDRRAAWQGQAARDLPAPSANAPRFAKRPDVFLLGFLSAIPDRIAQDHLGLTATGLQDVLERHGLTRIPNSFSGASPTRRSYEALLTLGNARILPDDESDDSGHAFTGAQPSAVFDAFAANGYRIDAVTEDRKFGRFAGPFIDRLTIARDASVCADTFLPDAVRNTLFIGACTLRDSRLYASFGPTEADLAETYAAAIGTALANPEPTVLLGHFRPPYHYRGPKLDAPDPAATADFAERYAASTETAARLMDRLLTEIEAQSPDAIVFVFGDMGVGLSEAPQTPEASAFALTDTFGVLAAVKYPGTCAALDHGGRPVTTPALLGDILACLSGTKPATAPPVIGIPSGQIDPAPFAYE